MNTKQKIQLGFATLAVAGFVTTANSIGVIVYGDHCTSYPKGDKQNIGVCTSIKINGEQQYYCNYDATDKGGGDPAFDCAGVDDKDD